MTLGRLTAPRLIALLLPRVVISFLWSSLIFWKPLLQEFTSKMSRISEVSYQDYSKHLP